ncbi:MAG: leucine-rich repeat domain-containing protein, partial [Planctomycetota bacterium]|nr:leucine-rich repeat domain-containing protein [Planctomycetota bacterium]
HYGSPEIGQVREPGVVFRADFEDASNPDNTWVFANHNYDTDLQDGWWHLTTRTGYQKWRSDSGYTDSGRHLRYGVPDQATYATASSRNRGRVTSRAIDLTGYAAVDSLRLSFNYLLNTDTRTTTDAARILISEDGGQFELLADGWNKSNRPAEATTAAGQFVDPTGTTAWRRAEFDLSAFVGHQIRIQFEFDTLDGIDNAREGWEIDDVIVRAESADLTVTRPGAEELVGGLHVTAPLQATAGDFNRDGHPDLVLGESSYAVFYGSLQVDNQLRGTTYVFWSVDQLGDVLSLGPLGPNDPPLPTPDLVVTGVGENEQLGTLPTAPALDVNGDGVDDLLIGAAEANVFSNGIKPAAGRVYVIYGEPQSNPLPANDRVDYLMNRSVTGSGDFLVDRGTNESQVFSDLDVNADGTLESDDFLLTPDTNERWYKFTTLGDGQSGDQLVMSPGAGLGTSAARLLASGTVVSAGADAPRTARQASVDLGPAGYSSGRANGISQSGQVVGAAGVVSGQELPFQWTEQAGLAQLTGAPAGSEAWAVNDAGMIVGSTSVLLRDALGNTAYSVPAGFQDIAASGTSILNGADDNFVELNQANLPGFQFTLYGQTYNSLFVSSNGLITFGSGSGAYYNTDLSSSLTQAAIAVFWDDLVVTPGALCWKLNGTGDQQQLVIQWTDVSFYLVGAETITFQAILSENGNTTQLNYPDLLSNHTGASGSSATVGIKGEGFTNRLVVSVNSGPNAMLGTGKSILIAPSGIVPPVYTPLRHATAYANGQLADLGTLGGPGASSVAYDVNNHQQIVGASEKPGAGNYHAFLADQSGMQSLETNTNLVSSQARAINDASRVVGQIETSAGVYHAFLWQGGATATGTMTDISGVASGWLLKDAQDINESGWIVGYGTWSGNDRAFVLKPQGTGYELTALATLGGSTSYATAINDAGQIVGYSTTAGGLIHAFLWEDGVITDLNDHATQFVGTGTALTQAWDINNDGTVVGTATAADNSTRPFLVTPRAVSIVAAGIEAGILEFDLSRFLNATDNLDLIGSATLRLRYFDNAGVGNLRVSVLSDEGDRTAEVTDASDSAALVTTLALSTLDPVRSGTLEVDLTSQVREKLRLGQTRLTVRLTGDVAGVNLKLHAPGGDAADDGLIVQVRGVAADLLDAGGVPVAQGQQAIDLRNLDAGTYYLRVYEPDSSPHTPCADPAHGVCRLPFSITIDAPAEGWVHRSPDRDVIYGGDGDDVLIGNSGLDRLNGESGDDGFVAEAGEVFDLIVGIENRTDPAVSELSNVPLTTQSPDPDVTLPDPVLSAAIARALGLPANQSGAASPILSSQLAQLTSLDLSGLSVSNLSGLQYAIGLRFLNLSDTKVTDLSPLVPKNRKVDGVVVGLWNLEYLGLDGTPLADLQPLTKLTKLKVLSLDMDEGTNVEHSLEPLRDLAKLTHLRVNNYGIQDVSPLGDLDNLQYLSLAGNKIQDMRPLAEIPSLSVLDLRNNQVVSIDALLGQTIIDNFEPGYVEQPGAGWTGGQNANGFQGDYRLLPSEQSGRYVDYRFENLAEGTYEVYATWPGHESRTYAATYSVQVGTGVATTHTVNQRFEPQGAAFGGRPWQLLQTVAVNASGVVTVRLSGGADGNLAADAVRLVRAVLPQLTTLDLRGNEFDVAAFQYVLPTLQSPDRPGTDDPATAFQEYGPLQADSGTSLDTGIRLDPTYGPRVAFVEPAAGTTFGISHIDITFGQPIDPASLAIDDVSLLPTSDSPSLGTALSRIGGTIGEFTAVTYANGLVYAATYNGLAILDVSNPAAPALRGTYSTDTAFGVQVVGTLAYVADGYNGLLVIDVCNPVAPVLQGTYNTPGSAQGVQVVGTLAYVADGSSGLQVIDVSNSAAPVLLGTYNTTGNALAVQVVGTLAYVADGGSGLQVVDVSNPAAPMLRGTYNTTGTAYGVSVVGTLAYVADEASGLQVIDVSNPAAPVLRGTRDTAGLAFHVYAIGTMAFVADYWSGLQVIDVSNPNSPVLRGTYDTTGLASGLYLVGTLLYVADRYSGLEVIDISNPAAPVLRGTYDRSVYASGVHVAGTLAYVADDISGLQVVDVSNPAAPMLRGACNTTGIAFGVDVVGTMAFVADYYSGLALIDVSNPDAPVLRATYDTTGLAFGVQVVGTLAYVADGASGLHVIDVSNPAAPVLRGTYDTTGEAREVQVVGTLAYVADGVSGLQVIDVSNPAAPMLRGTYNTTGEARGVQVVGTLAYVADGASGLQVIDVSNPAAPMLRGTYNTTGLAYGVQVVETLAYVADESSGLQVIDVSNPAGPVLRATYDTAGSAYGVQVVGTLAYVADGSSGLQVIDVDYYWPAWTAQSKAPFDSQGVQVVGTLAYVADGASGLQVIDVSNPAAPVLRGTYNTTGYVMGVQVVGTLAYVADYGSGLQVIDVSNPAAPVLRGTWDNTSGSALGVQVVGTL